MKSKILFITLSNIGDAILTLPALDYLKESFPESSITVLGSERSKDIFINNPFVDKFIPYNKHSKLEDKIKLFLGLWGKRFNLVVDLKDSFLGFILKLQSGHILLKRIPKVLKHMKDRHLYQSGCLQGDAFLKRGGLNAPSDDTNRIVKLLREGGIEDGDKIAVISAGARSHTKRWPKESFAALIPKLKEEFGFKIVLAGDREDVPINKYLNEGLKSQCLDLSAKTNLKELSVLLSRAALLISNDSAIMHMGSYLNIPVVAIFGITDEKKYGPWSDRSIVVKKEIGCRPCQKAQCRFGTLECLRHIKVEDVLRGVRIILEEGKHSRTRKDNFKRILIVRTDRIGDLLLSTPVIKAVREKYPDAFIAMAVSPYAKDIVDGNPYSDQVITYDKDKKHKSWFRTIKFARNLKKKKFDLALVLHPTNRVHIFTYLAQIPKRVGYNKKFGFLLTDKIPHTKEQGEKHELEYNLDLLRYLNIDIRDKDLFMPIKKESEEWVGELFRQNGIMPQDKLLAINPAASCPSKIWPAERFAEVADKIAQKHGFKILVVSGSKDLVVAENVIKNMRSLAISLAGMTSVSQLASLLKRCKLFISNDSGPVHIASAVGTPVISIFGRRQKGLSPKRWGPVGLKDIFVHKDVGCIECLAHNCKKEFACLKAITVEEVFKAAEGILKN